MEKRIEPYLNSEGYQNLLEQKRNIYLIKRRNVSGISDKMKTIGGQSTLVMLARCWFQNTAKSMVQTLAVSVCCVLEQDI